jgi:hypothetical protein
MAGKARKTTRMLVSDQTLIISSSMIFTQPCGMGGPPRMPAMSALMALTFQAAKTGMESAFFSIVQGSNLCTAAPHS